MSNNIRPSHLIIDLAAIADNYRAIKAFSKARLVMPVLKADAYGHGLIEVARCLERAGADYFGVAFLEEALELRHAGIKTAILVLGGLSGSQVDTFLENDLDFTASSIYKLEKIENAAAAKNVKARVHLKIDTGMNRLGVHHYSAEDFLKTTIKCPHIEVRGLFSHFADAERENQDFSRLQIERFGQVLQTFEQLAGYRPICHIANSGALLQLPEAHFDMVRPGLLLYGINPCQHLKQVSMALQPALTLKSQVVYFKVVKPGAHVSYECTWTAAEQTRVVTIPLGYGDGYPRQLSNKASVLIGAKRYPIIGKICMDQLLVNIGPGGEAHNGDEVILVGQQGDQVISVMELVQLSGQDPREFLLNLKLRLPKVFRREYP